MRQALQDGASRSAFYGGRVVHQRLQPLRHRLGYRVFSLLLDLDELPTLHARLRLFSVDRFNLFSLRLADHGAGDATGPRDHVERQLQAAGLATGGAIRLLAMPRILGYAFNPLSVYFCHRPDGALQAMLYEVNNTFGERHSYLLPTGPEAGGVIEQQCEKRLHVSPFLPLAMQYRFRIRPPGERLHVGVNVHSAEGPVLAASLDAQRQPLTDGTLLRAFFAYPLLTLKVIAAIHWEALKLWCKGARLHAKPQPPPHPVTAVPLQAHPRQNPHRQDQPTTP